jgi:formylglycine-generating enzyme required for sulfatase activity
MRENGIDAILDQFHCKPGTDLAKFMETSVRKSKFVLLVCTPNFAQKADAGAGGVGYEKAIVTGEIFTGKAEETKFVPLLRDGDAKESLPSYLGSRLFTDFRDDSLFETKLEELLRHFHDEPLYTPPPIGPKPDWTKAKKAPTAKKQTVSKPAKKSTASASTQKLPLEQTLQNTIGMEFVLIPAGTFRMGSHLSPEELKHRYGVEDKFYKSEHPQHKVTISEPFYLQATAVTQGQWEKVLGFNPSHFDKCGDDCPVEKVSWEDVQIFIEELNEIEGTEKYRLPTEAEWEYACRGVKIPMDFFFGDDADKLGEYVWYRNNSEEQTHPVGKKKPNRWDLYDMHGNVWEWVEDDWHDTYGGAPSDGSAWIDESRGAARVVRGGGWDGSALRCRSAYRGNAPDVRGNDLGFRLARSVALGP